MAAGTATLEDAESECIRSFILADHDKATQLLPSLHQPAAVRTSYNFFFNDVSTKLCENVSLLHLAALHGWMDIVTNLVNMYESDCECRDNQESAPLHYAALGGSLPVVKYLIIEQHCDPNNRGEWGRTPLHYGYQKGHMDIIKYLTIEQDCDPTVLDYKKIKRFLSKSKGCRVVKSTTGPQCKLTRNKHGMVTRLTC